jgi:hypothetical protein
VQCLNGAYVTKLNLKIVLPVTNLYVMKGGKKDAIKQQIPLNNLTLKYLL